MKKYLYFIVAVFFLGLTACEKLDVPPLNVVQDKDIFTNESGISAYMARIYSRLPIEDFKYSPTISFNAFVTGSFSGLTGEALSRDMPSTRETFNYWADAYTVIRECNYFMEVLPTYASNFTGNQVNNWLGEVRFLRAVTYFALVKRYGGVPIVNTLLAKPGQTISELTATVEELKIPRSSEEKVYDAIAED